MPISYRVSNSRNAPPSIEYTTDTSGRESSPTMNLTGVPDRITELLAGVTSWIDGSTMLRLLRSTSTFPSSSVRVRLTW